MKAIFNLIMGTAATYFGLNWAADNPMLIKGFRNNVDQQVESGYEFALFQFKSYNSEPAPKPEKKTKKKGQ